MAKTTLGSVLTYSTTSGTFTTPPMLMPQWHTKTPILGPVPRRSASAGSVLSVTSVSRAGARIPPAQAAAPLASMTVSGMSLGPAKAPQTKTPPRLVSTGFSSRVFAKPCSSSSMPRALASFAASFGGVSPTERTTMSNSSSTSLPSSVT